MFAGVSVSFKELFSKGIFYSNFWMNVFVGIYYVSINIGGYFQYAILFFEGITYFLVLIFFGLFLYKLSKQKSLS
ncbi:hypothetical protein DI43_17820 [Geobacillus sp. CAMR12739]|nr:hypothetical protein DI43_17820 [Geobacillus sp. CAMR12739]